MEHLKYQRRWGVIALRLLVIGPVWLLTGCLEICFSRCERAVHWLDEVLPEPQKLVHTDEPAKDTSIDFWNAS